MASCSDDVRHMTDKSSARIRRGRRAVLQGPIRTNLQPQLQGTPSPTASGGTNLRIPSTRLFKQNESWPAIAYAVQTQQNESGPRAINGKVAIGFVLASWTDV
ncbi:unnamed protein product [Protopolystoma xenopodis]|uniref:Uncharacterized protein n=1 Tax=Protopolystoma xenopodis TaxID=117903 RepID=A0A448XE48_9PLAT|nr:unnamed protein product [Protopolystoma xenopodis]